MGDEAVTPEPGIALVAGAAGDIGRCVLDVFARRHLTPVAWDRQPVPGAAHAHRLDLLNDAATRAAADALDRLPGELRHVAVVAGGGDLDDLTAPGIEHLAPAAFRRVVDANLVTAYSVVHHTTAALKRATGDRSITLLSSINALGGYGAPGYSAAKAALSGLAKALAPQLGPHGIRINVLLLGTVDTANFDRLAREQGRDADLALPRLRPFIERFGSRAEHPLVRQAAAVSLSAIRSGSDLRRTVFQSVWLDDAETLLAGGAELVAPAHGLLAMATLTVNLAEERAWTWDGPGRDARPTSLDPDGQRIRADVLTASGHQRAEATAGYARHRRLARVAFRLRARRMFHRLEQEAAEREDQSRAEAGRVRIW